MNSLVQGEINYMNIIMNFPKDKNVLEDKVAYIRALLMQKYIDDLLISEEQKYNINKYLIEELQND